MEGFCEIGGSGDAAVRPHPNPLLGKERESGTPVPLDQDWHGLMVAWRFLTGDLLVSARMWLREHQRGVGHGGRDAGYAGGGAIEAADWDYHHCYGDFGAVAAELDGGETFDDFAAESLLEKAAGVVAKFNWEENFEGGAD